MPTKKTPRTKSKKSAETKMVKPETKRNIRLGIGIFILLLGAFLTLAVISYFFTWQQDQDSLISSKGLGYFLFKDSSVIHNLGGRLGAASAHYLVFQGLGIFSLLLTLWIAALGGNIINGKKIFPLLKWLRWLAFGFLFLCPLVAFILPNSEFPLGGALGNAFVDWMGGFGGKAGNIAALIGVLFFFLFIVFNWDIQPLIQKVPNLMTGKELLPATNQNGSTEEDEDQFKGFRHFTEEEEKDLTEKIEKSQEGGPIHFEMPNEHRGNSLKEDDEAPELEITINQSQTPNEEEDEFQIIDKSEEGEKEDAEEDDGTGMKLEVNSVTDKSLIPKQGAHISIESGEPYDPSLDLSDYKYPTLDLLEDRRNEYKALDHQELQENKDQIINTLKSFGIGIQKISATVGPTITLYEIVPEEGIRISKIRNLEDDIALSLAALGIRIIAPIPGRGTIGIEVPNKNKHIVSIRTMLSSEKFINSKMSLPIALGKMVNNDNYIVDLAKMPHLLMAGATGQGKSVGINTILVSLLYKKHPSQLKFVLIDPKKVELSIYRVIEKHFLAMLPNEEEPIITDTKKVINTLNALTIEMDNRYDLLKEAGTRNIKEYNAKFIQRKLNPELGHKYLPFIVLVIDEFADLIMTAGKEVEQPIARLAQLARAVGIHLIIATQRPSVNVITGIIKANFPARAAFRVTSKVDSRTILDSGGADQLVGQGDMLISTGSDLIRLQCAFVDTPEVERVVNFIGEQRGYPTAFQLPEYLDESEEGAKPEIDLHKKRDKLFEECAQLVVNSQSGSTSMLQRKYNIGYNRAGRIMDQLEAAGVVGGASGSKPRDVLIRTDFELKQLLDELGL